MYLFIFKNLLLVHQILHANKGERSSGTQFKFLSVININKIQMFKSAQMFIILLFISSTSWSYPPGRQTTV